MDRFDEWVLSPAGREQRRYEFVNVEKNFGRAEAERRDAEKWERDTYVAELNKIGRDALNDFRSRGF